MKENNTILITGANGFIANFLAKNLKDKGFNIIGISSSKKENPNYTKIYNKRLGESIKDIIPNYNIICAIHTAYTEDPDNYEINYSGTIKWANELMKNNVSKQIFLSSISAKQNSISEYGKIKYKTDEWFNINNMVSLRLGLVIGNGGMLKKIINLLNSSKIIPIISGNKFKIFITDLKVILCSILFIINNNKINSGIFYLHNNKSIGNKDFLKTLSQYLKLKNIFINIPYSLAYISVKLFNTLRIKIPGNLSIINLKGLKQNSNFEKDSDLINFNCKEEDLVYLLKKHLT